MLHTEGTSFLALVGFLSPLKCAIYIVPYDLYDII
nr:MAG TPA: hypothetical protein [Caudoviricetes sp.]